MIRNSVKLTTARPFSSHLYQETYSSIEGRQTPVRASHQHDPWWENKECWSKHCCVESMRQQDASICILFNSGKRLNSDSDIDKRETLTSINKKRQRYHQGKDNRMLSSIQSFDSWQKATEVVQRDIALNEENGLQHLLRLGQPFLHTGRLYLDS